MILFPIALFLILNVASATPRLSNRGCPLRNRTIKTGIVLPSECVQLQGKWVRSWQSCGSLCTRNRACKAWTYKGGRCNLYKNGKKTCGFVTSRGVGTIAEYSGCQVWVLKLP